MSIKKYGFDMFRRIFNISTMLVDISEKKTQANALIIYINSRYARSALRACLAVYYHKRTPTISATDSVCTIISQFVYRFVKSYNKRFIIFRHNVKCFNRTRRLVYSNPIVHDFFLPKRFVRSVKSKRTNYYSV